MSHLLPLHVAKVAHQDQSSELNRRSGTTSSAQPRNWKQATTEDNALMKKKTPLIPIPVVWRLALIAVTIQCCSVLGLVFRVGHNTFSLVAEFLFWSGALATLAALPLLLYQLLLLHRIWFRPQCHAFTCLPFPGDAMPCATTNDFFDILCCNT